MMNADKYSKMLEELAAEYPELEEGVAGLQAEMADLGIEAPAEDDMAPLDEEMPMDMEEDIDAEMPMPSPVVAAKGKKPIPADLEDEEEEEMI